MRHDKITDMDARGGAPEGGVVAALPTTPPVGLGGAEVPALEVSSIERRWGRAAGVAMRTCIDQSVC